MCVLLGSSQKLQLQTQSTRPGSPAAATTSGQAGQEEAAYAFCAHVLRPKRSYAAARRVEVQQSIWVRPTCDQMARVLPPVIGGHAGTRPPGDLTKSASKGTGRNAGTWWLHMGLQLGGAGFSPGPSGQLLREPFRLLSLRSCSCPTASAFPVLLFHFALALVLSFYLR